MSEFTYRVRNSLVMLRKEKTGVLRGLEMPENSAEGMKFFVHAVGDRVEDLKVGDRVMLMGSGEEKFYPVPGESDLLIVDEKLVAYVFVEEKNTLRVLDERHWEYTGGDAESFSDR